MFEVSVYCAVKYINMVNSGEAGARWVSVKDSWIPYPPRHECNLSVCYIPAFNIKLQVRKPQHQRNMHRFQYTNMVKSGEAGARWVSMKDSWIPYPPRHECNLSVCYIPAFNTITSAKASTPTEYAQISVQSSAAFHEGWDSSPQRKA